MRGINRAENIYLPSCSSSSFAEFEGAASQEDANTLFLRDYQRGCVGHRWRSFNGIMEIYVSGNCEFVLLGAIIDELYILFFFFFCYIPRGNIGTQAR